MPMRFIISLLALGAQATAAELPLRIDGPVPDAATPLPVAGGIPFPRGALDSVDHLRLIDADGHEVPAQATRLAVWPGGSVKWALIDAVIAPSAARSLRLAYGADVRRGEVPGALTATASAAAVEIAGPRLKAIIRKAGVGFIDELALDGRSLIAKEAPARTVVTTLRLPDLENLDAMPCGSFLCRAGLGTACVKGRVAIDAITVESPGPVRVTVLLRGAVLLPGFGAGLPEEVTKRDPAGRMPFSLRVSFFAGTGIVHAQQQVVFSGEPDRDLVTRWSLELPRLAGEQGLLCAEPGVNLSQRGGELTLAADQHRRCWAPLASGVAVIRHGWEDRPTAITMGDGTASIDLWPALSGVFDLRRYAREWSVGESGDTTDAKSIERYARYAARGIAKSHEVVIDFAAPAAAAQARAVELSERALLLAPPGWYASSQALGPMVPEQHDGVGGELDAMARRRLDYHLFAQDLFRWHGQLVYGFWQSRYGQAHRNDRWDCDYGRWGWSLDDGGGRIGQVLMQEFLRTLDRRYFDAGEAFSRIAYDTNLVHTQQHLENAAGWWTAIGLSHRHNVQPFGCPYIGMRGSYPVGQRLLWELTGDGLIADGLDLVAGSALAYAGGAASRLGNSGGSDGQGSAAHALLWKYEATGDQAYLRACRTILDRTGFFPAKDTDALGYGPSFGVFTAAGEYAALSDDRAFADRVVAMARVAAGAKNARDLLSLVAIGALLSEDAALKQRTGALMAEIAAGGHDGLEDEPRATWPGHGGWKTPALDANALRDLPLAMAVAAPQAPSLGWPSTIAGAAIPSAPPADWYRPGGAQTADERVPEPVALLNERPGTGGADFTVGGATWTAKSALIDGAAIVGAHPLARPITAYVSYAKRATYDQTLAGITTIAATTWQVGRSGDALIAAAATEGTSFVARMRTATVDGVPALRIELACKPLDGFDIANWGLLVPCAHQQDAHAVMTTAPGRFRLERCRLDQNDERLPNWLSSEYHYGEGAPLWPLWRQSGIEIGAGSTYRIWRANRRDTAPVFCDQGEGPGTWLDLTDRSATPRWGLTARVLRPNADAVQSIRVALETGEMDIQFHSAAAPPIAATKASAGLAGTVDLILHDGFRPPLSRPELTPPQYDAFIADLDYDENYGLAALRFALSITHKVEGREWLERIRDLGVEPREILYGMLNGGGLAKHCQRLGVRWDGNDVEGSVRRVIEHYRASGAPAHDR